MYYVFPFSNTGVKHASFYSSVNNPTASIWHSRLMHRSWSSLERAVKNNMVTGCELSLAEISAQHESLCDGCGAGKMHRIVSSSLPSNEPRESLLAGEMLHSDLLDMGADAKGSHRYVATFIDDASRRAFVYLLKRKDDFSKAAELCMALVATQTGRKLRYFQSDRGGEYLQGAFVNALKTAGVIHRFSNTECPEQNGVAERFNRTLVESVRSTLAATGVSHSHWGECLKAACYVYNLLPHSARSVVPWEGFHGIKPTLSILRAWGCKAIVYLIKRKQGFKLDPRGVQGIMVGYDVEPGVQSNGYRILLGSGEVVSSKDVLFDETVFPKDTRTVTSAPIPIPSISLFDGGFVLPQARIVPPTSSLPTLEQGSDALIAPVVYDVPVSDASEDYYSSEDTDLDPPVEAETALPMETVGRSRRPNAGVAPTRYGYLALEDNEASSSGKNAPPSRSFDRYSHRKEDDSFVENRSTWKVLEYFSLKATATDIPHSDTLNSEQSSEWREAEQSELDGITQQGVYEVVSELPPGKTALGTRMIYTLKADGRKKARLVVQGFRQVKGVDHQETFAPASHATVARLLLSVAANQDREIVQGDISMAFLNAPLEEEIYVTAPNGQIWRLKKALYGLKQAPRAWYKTFGKEMATFGYKPSLYDPALYIKRLDDGEILYFIIHVDDFMFSAPKGRLDLVEQFLSQMRTKFVLRDVGEPSVFCGLEISRNRSEGWLKVSQQKFMEQLIQEWIPTAASINTPAEPGCKIARHGVPLSEERTGEFRQVVGSLLWLATRTRPDIAFIVGFLTRFFSAPTREQWEVAMRVLRYLKGTLTLGLLYKAQNGLNLIGYADADWAGDEETARSTSGFCFLYGGAAISWLSKLQTCVATSTQHAEYMSCGTSSKEGVWIRMLLSELNVSPSDATLIYGDNEPALALIDNPIISPRTKHILVAFHYSREQVELQELRFQYISTKEMVADIFTKSLDFVKLDYFRQKLGVLP